MNCLMSLHSLPPEELALQPVALDCHPGPGYAQLQRKWQGIPAIERAANGRLWAAWYSGGRTEDTNNHVLLVTSMDRGLTWSEPVLVIDPPDHIRAADPVLWHDPHGRLWLFWMQTGTYDGQVFDGRGGVWATVAENSNEADPSWSTPLRIANGAMMNKPTVLSCGAWLLPIAIWRPKERTATRRHHVPDDIYSMVYISRDDGITFEFHGRADVPNRTCDEHMVLERKDSSLWMFVRRSDGIGRAVSLDGGKSWDADRNCFLAGPNSRFHVRRLASGRILLVNHHYEFKGRSHLTALLSDDDGISWPHHLLLDQRQDASYPDAVETADGRIFVIYDHRRVGEGEILLQTLTEDDIVNNRNPGHDSGRLIVISSIARPTISGPVELFSNPGLIDQNVGAAFKQNDPTPSGSDAHCPAPRGHGAGSIHAHDGQISLQPFYFHGSRLHLNFATAEKGSIRVQIETWDGKQLPGFSAEECCEIHGTQTNQTAVVYWHQVADVSRLSGTLIRVRFFLRQADLFSFEFADT